MILSLKGLISLLLEWYARPSWTWKAPPQCFIVLCWVCECVCAPSTEVLMDKGVINTTPHGLMVLATLLTAHLLSVSGRKQQSVSQCVSVSHSSCHPACKHVSVKTDSSWKSPWPWSLSPYPDVEKMKI